MLGKLPLLRRYTRSTVNGAALATVSTPATDPAPQRTIDGAVDAWENAVADGLHDAVWTELRARYTASPPFVLEFEGADLDVDGRGRLLAALEREGLRDPETLAGDSPLRILVRREPPSPGLVAESALRALTRTIGDLPEDLAADLTVDFAANARRIVVRRSR